MTAHDKVSSKPTTTAISPLLPDCFLVLPPIASAVSPLPKHPSDHAYGIACFVSPLHPRRPSPFAASQLAPPRLLVLLGVPGQRLPTSASLCTRRATPAPALTTRTRSLGCHIPQPRSSCHRAACRCSLSAPDPFDSTQNPEPRHGTGTTEANLRCWARPPYTDTMYVQASHSSSPELVSDSLSFVPFASTAIFASSGADSSHEQCLCPFHDPECAEVFLQLRPGTAAAPETELYRHHPAPGEDRRQILHHHGLEILRPSVLTAYPRWTPC